MKDHTDVFVLAGIALVMLLLLPFVQANSGIVSTLSSLLPVVIGAIGGVAKGSTQSMANVGTANITETK